MCFPFYISWASWVPGLFVQQYLSPFSQGRNECIFFGGVEANLPTDITPQQLIRNNSANLQCLETRYIL